MQPWPVTDRSSPAVGRFSAALGRLALMACAVVLLACPKQPRPATTPETADELKDLPRSSAKPEQARPPIVLRGARVMTASGVVYEKGEILIEGERIAAVGPSVPAPKSATVVDVSGKTITPGIIDTHSHIGVYASPGLGAHSDGNEAVAPVTAGVRAADGYWPQDPQIDRARAGGVTTMQILPGSANLIGGRSVTVKTYPGARSVEDARFEAAPYGLKMACGENPKRVYGEKGGPQTRMGNMAGFRNAFQDAVEYRRKWTLYRDKLRRHLQKKSEPARDSSDGDEDGEDEPDDPPEPPERDLNLETLVGVLEGKILVHNHCYRADEMSLMLELAEEFGFSIRSFHHAVEAYKIADRLAAHDTAASVWADWWGFKAEAFDAVRQNAALVSKAGARAIIHSDSATGVQRLNQEAAKAMYAGRRLGIEISEDEALRWITANAAWALGIHHLVGTIEQGKQADLVIWDGDPFSVYTKAERVYIEGEPVYDRNDPALQPSTDFETGLQNGGTTTEVP